MSWNSENILEESKSEWGGIWTEKKLDAFAKYVSAYLRIMNRNKYWKTIYFDGFAGSGTKKSNCKSQIYRQLLLTEQEERLYKGAAERVLSLPDKLRFDYHYFIDSNEESLKNLKKRLSDFQESYPYEFQYRTGDCNQHLLDLSKAMKSNKTKYASLVLLDPFGMQINWNAIESLKETRTDIWILIPTGVIVNRLLDKSCQLKNSQKLQSFFGLSKDEIIDYFYQKEVKTTLFGNEEVITKVSKPIEKIAELYSKRLKSIWKFVTDKPLKLENSRGVPIFHFVFASNHPAAVKIAKEIIKSL